MKKIQKINKLVLALVIFTTFSCINDDEITIAPIPKTLYEQNFNTAIDNTDLNISDWENIALVGTKKWKEEVFDGNGYAEMSSYNSGDDLNESWLVTPELNLDGYNSYQVFFDICQHHLDVDSVENSLKVYYTNNYTGDVTTTNWTNITPSSNIPNKSVAWYEFLNSKHDLKIQGKIRFAFKFLGSGSDTALDGAFQLDNFKIYGIK